MKVPNKYITLRMLQRNVKLTRVRFSPCSPRRPGSVDRSRNHIHKVDATLGITFRLMGCKTHSNNSNCCIQQYILTIYNSIQTNSHVHQIADVFLGGFNDFDIFLAWEMSKLLKSQESVRYCSVHPVILICELQSISLRNRRNHTK